MPMYASCQISHGAHGAQVAKQATHAVYYLRAGCHDSSLLLNGGSEHVRSLEERAPWPLAHLRDGNGMDGRIADRARLVEYPLNCLLDRDVPLSIPPSGDVRLGTRYHVYASLLPELSVRPSRLPVSPDPTGEDEVLDLRIGRASQSIRLSCLYLSPQLLRYQHRPQTGLT